MKEFENVGQDKHVKSAEMKYEILPPILRPDYADALIGIINKMDGDSFKKLSKTCRYIHGICKMTRGVKIPIDCVVDVTEAEFRVWIGEKNHLYDTNRNHHYLTSAEIDRLLEKKSRRRFSVQMIRFVDVTLSEHWMTATQEFLSKLGSKRAERLWIRGDVLLPAEKLNQFVDHLGAKEFRSERIIPNCSITHLLKNVSYFYYDHNVPDDFYFRAKVPPRLHLMGANMFSVESFMEIIEGWAFGDFEIDEWNLGRSFNPTEPMTNTALLAHFAWVHIFELFNFPLPSERPLLLLEWMDFPRYLLRSDGQILGIFFQMKGAGIFLRQAKLPHLHNKLPKLFPITDDRYFETVIVDKLALYNEKKKKKRGGR